MVMTAIKAVIFDFGGTLDSDGLHWFDRIYRGISRRQSEIVAEDFYACADEAAGDISFLPDTPQLNMAQTVLRLCEYIHAGLRRRSESFVWGWQPREIADEFVAQALEYIDRNRRVLEELHRRYRLGCLSNNWGNTAGWCRDLKLAPYFETMIDSTVVGAVKPDKVIFQAALDELQLAAARCAYVGDRYDCDVLGAHAAGLQPIWLSNSNGSEPSAAASRQDGVGEVAPVKPRRITKLPDLLRLDL